MSDPTSRKSWTTGWPAPTAERSRVAIRESRRRGTLSLPVSRSRISAGAMFSNTSASYGVKCEARSISSLVADSERHRFLIGTRSLKESNELHLVEFTEENNELVCEQVYSHPQEIWSLSPCPYDPALVFTVYNKGSGFGSTLWRMEGVSADEGGDDSSTAHSSYSPGGYGGYDTGPTAKLERVFDLPDKAPGFRLVQKVLWNPNATARGGATAGDVVSFEDNMIRRWSLANGGAQESATASIASPPPSSFALYGAAASAAPPPSAPAAAVPRNPFTSSAPAAVSRNPFTQPPPEYVAPPALSGGGNPGCHINAGAWDPHHAAGVATAHDTAVRLWDLRSMKPTGGLDVAHALCVRDVDYNPNKPSVLATAGDDCLAKIWDTRALARGPVKVIGGHSHWVWAARYNPFHDQLLLTGGSDGLVNLWRVSSVSSAPMVELGGVAGSSGGGSGSGGGGGGHGRGRGDDGPEGPDVEETPVADARLRTFDEHEAGVYAAAWSASDAWVFGTLSADGRMVVNHVPSTEKYKILL